MLSLYEAAHLGIRGEEILDEALSFTTAHLKSVATNSSSPLVEQVIHALEQSLHRGMTKLEARHYISFYEKDPSRNEVLLKLAKLDFNRLQSLHLEELGEISRWWKDLDLASKIPYARNRVVECYFCIMGVYPEPQYSFGRTILTKVTAMTSILDDTYDAYGTFEELQLFTDAIERWDVDETDKLPEYMKAIYLALLDIYNEIEEEMRNEGRSYCVSYAKEEMKVLIRTYFTEAKWFSEGHIPTFKESLENALVSCGYAMILLTSFVGMGEIATKEVFDWVSKTPKIVRSACLIGRLMDDIVSNEFEQERGHVSSAIECYMNENGVSREEAITEIRKLINNTWKDINEQCVRPTAAAMPPLMRAVNLARVFDVAYKREDGYTNAHVLKAHIVLLLIDPIPI
nr:TPA_asm: hypothetical protein HUJ06_008703 [Nelumbo nucifera]